jgi:hypothetical protein
MEYVYNEKIAKIYDALETLENWQNPAEKTWASTIDELTTQIRSGALDVSGDMPHKRSDPLTRLIKRIAQNETGGHYFKNEVENSKATYAALAEIGKRADSFYVRQIEASGMDELIHYTNEVNPTPGNIRCALDIVEALTEIYAARPETVTPKTQHGLRSIQANLQLDADITKESIRAQFGEVALPEHRVVVALKKLNEIVNKAPDATSPVAMAVKPQK